MDVKEIVEYMDMYMHVYKNDNVVLVTVGHISTLATYPRIAD